MTILELWGDETDSITGQEKAQMKRHQRNLLDDRPKFTLHDLHEVFFTSKDREGELGEPGTFLQP